MRALRSWSPRARVAPWKWMGMAWYPDSGLKVVMFRLCMSVWKVTKQWRRDLWRCKEGSKWSWRTRTQYVGPFCKRKSCCIEYWRRLHGGRPIALWHHTYGGHCGSEPRTPLSNFGLLLATTYCVLQSTSPVLFQYYCVTKNCKILRLAPRLWFQFQQVLASPCFARASKSDTWTSPFCTCQEKRRRTHLLVDPAIIWRFHSWTRLLLRCRSYMGFSDCNCTWNLRSCNVSTNNIPVPLGSVMPRRKVTFAKPYEVNSLDSKRDLRKIQDLLASCWHQEHAHSGYGSRVPVWCGCGQSRNSSAAGWPCHADWRCQLRGHIWPSLLPHLASVKTSPQMFVLVVFVQGYV